MGTDFSDVKEVLRKVAKVVGGDEFRQKSAAFLAEHSDVFSFDDENKLEYSQIHDRYQEEIEVALLDALPPEEIENLLEQLPAYMDQVSAADMDADVGEALELLTNLGDFQAFKDIMLVAKRDKAAKAAPEAGTMAEVANTDLGVEGIETLFAEMASATGQGGWETKSDKGWFKAEMKKRDDGREYCRTTLLTDLTPQQCFALFMDYEHPRRSEWLSHVKSLKLIKDNGPDDKVFRNEIQLSGLMKVALAGMPKYFDMRSITRHDFPEKGEKTVVIVPWKVDTDEYDKAAPFTKLQTICFKPVKDSPNECLLVVMEETNLKWMPQWMQLMLINTVSPKMMNSMITKYKKVMQL